MLNLNASEFIPFVRLKDAGKPLELDDIFTIDGYTKDGDAILMSESGIESIVPKEDFDKFENAENLEWNWVIEYSNGDITTTGKKMTYEIAQKTYDNAISMFGDYTKGFTIPKKDS